MARITSLKKGASNLRNVIREGSIVRWRGTDYECVPWTRCSECAFYNRGPCQRMTCGWIHRESQDKYRVASQNLMFIPKK